MSRVFCLGFILFGTLWFSWTWVVISFPILGKFSTIISSGIFSWSFFLSSSSGTSIIWMFFIVEFPRCGWGCNAKLFKIPKHILIKLTKIKHKEQILKAAREKQQITHKGIPIRITADLSIETLQAKREWQDILKVIKEKNLQSRLLFPARISFKYEGEIKSFTGKQKLREFSTTKPALQQMLKDLL